MVHGDGLDQETNNASLVRVELTFEVCGAMVVNRHLCVVVEPEVFPGMEFRFFAVLANRETEVIHDSLRFSVVIVDCGSRGQIIHDPIDVVVFQDRLLELLNFRSFVDRAGEVFAVLVL